MLSTLPVRRVPMMVGRWLALGVIAVHVLIPLGWALSRQHGWSDGIAVASVYVCTSVLAVVLTQPEAWRRLEARQSFGSIARFVPSISIVSAVVALRGPMYVVAVSIGMLTLAFMVFWRNEKYV